MQNFSSVGALPPAGICLIAVSKIFYSRDAEARGEGRGASICPRRAVAEGRRFPSHAVF